MEEKKQKKARTSITIDLHVLEAARTHCDEQKTSVSSFIEQVVAEKLNVKPTSGE